MWALEEVVEVRRREGEVAIDLLHGMSILRSLVSVWSPALLVYDHGKEGVVGSSPTPGFRFPPA
jgi:hypothetical protein